MHGRLKVKTTEQQREEKRKERAKKLSIFQTATKLAFSKRHNGQFDDEALKVTTDILSMNPEFYTLWNFRKEIILDMKNHKDKLNLDELFKSDLNFVESCLRNSPKSYGAWHHRCWIMTTMCDPDWEKELKLCNLYLTHDERNFHCWDYRRFVIQNSGISYEEELKYSLEKIETNFSNYSSWHYRSRLLPKVHPGNTYKNINEEKLLAEFELVQNAAFTDPNDQSAWFYHKWLLGRDDRKPEIYCIIFYLAEKKVVVSFSNPASVKNNKPLNLFLDSKAVSCHWSPANKNERFGISSVWLGSITDSLVTFADDSPIQFKVTYDEEIYVETISNCLENVVYLKGKSKAKDFRSQFSVATVNFLKDELDSCQQLQELEPENKWTMLTSVLLMKAIDATRFQSEMIRMLRDLTDIDPKRVFYYDDLRSKLLIENAVENKPIGETELMLNGMELTALFHTNFLADLTLLNLKGNNLSSIPSIYNLPFLKVLILDDNQMENCEGFDCLSQLTSLSMKNNKLSEESSITSLYQCKMLKSINLEKNPIMKNMPGLLAIVQSHLNIISLSEDI